MKTTTVRITEDKRDNLKRVLIGKGVTLEELVDVIFTMTDVQILKHVKVAQILKNDSKEEPQS